MDKRALQKVIGDNLYHFRTELKLTREQLSEKVGVSAPFYANLESGKKMMSVVTLRKLADILGVPADALLYPDHPSSTVERIQACLRKEPEDMALFAEKLIRFCIEEIPYAGSEANGEIGNGLGVE